MHHIQTNFEKSISFVFLKLFMLKSNQMSCTFKTSRYQYLDILGKYSVNFICIDYLINIFPKKNDNA